MIINLTSTPSIYSLSDEEQLLILNFLSQTDLKTMSLVSKHFNQLTSDNTLWKKRIDKLELKVGVGENFRKVLILENERMIEKFYKGLGLEMPINLRYSDHIQFLKNYIKINKYDASRMFNKFLKENLYRNGGDEPYILNISPHIFKMFFGLGIKLDVHMKIAILQSQPFHILKQLHEAGLKLDQLSYMEFMIVYERFNEEYRNSLHLVVQSKGEFGKIFGMVPAERQADFMAKLVSNSELVNLQLKTTLSIQEMSIDEDSDESSDGELTFDCQSFFEKDNEEEEGDMNEGDSFKRQRLK